MEIIKRQQDQAALSKLMASFPVVAILGPRQCGKTTLAEAIGADHYFDLENPRDAARLDQPQLALEDLSGVIVIDEIQRLPDLFPLLRYEQKTKIYHPGQCFTGFDPPEFRIACRPNCLPLPGWFSFK